MIVVFTFYFVYRLNTKVMLVVLVGGYFFKAAIINNFTITLIQMTTYSVKGINCSATPTENYHQTLKDSSQIYRAL